MRRRQPGPFKWTASEYNQMVDAVNRLQSTAPVNLSQAPNIPHYTIYAVCADDVSLYQPLHIAGSLNPSEAAYDIGTRAKHIFAQAEILSASVSPQDLLLGVAQAPAEAGTAFPVLVAGVTPIAISGADASKPWLDYDDSGTLTMGDAGRWRVLPYSDSAYEGAIVVLPSAAMPGEAKLELYQIKAIDAATGKCMVAPVTMLPGETPNYISSSDPADWREVYYLKDN